MTENTTSFRQLVVWQKAHAFVLAVYRLTECFPPDERFGLTSQLKRAAVSIAANVVEGYRKRGPADKARFFNIAQGSADECLYYLILVSDLDIADTQTLQEQLDEVSRLLHAYGAAILR